MSDELARYLLLGAPAYATSNFSRSEHQFNGDSDPTDIDHSFSEPRAAVAEVAGANNAYVFALQSFSPDDNWSPHTQGFGKKCLVPLVILSSCLLLPLIYVLKNKLQLSQIILPW